MMDRKTCPKHVEFYSKNKFEKLVHLIGFIIRIYHNAWSSECQISYVVVLRFTIGSKAQQRVNFRKACDGLDWVHLN